MAQTIKKGFLIPAEVQKLFADLACFIGESAEMLGTIVTDENYISLTLQSRNEIVCLNVTCTEGGML